MNTEPTLIFKDFKNDVGQVAVKPWEWRLTADLGNLEEWSCRWYGIVKREDGFYIYANPGCAWDYATKYFDGDYIKEASLGHDILHWLIARGIIDEKYNSSIDQEFYLLLRDRGGIPHWRAAILRKAVNLVLQKKTGIDMPKYALRNGNKWEF